MGFGGNSAIAHATIVDPCKVGCDARAFRAVIDWQAMYLDDNYFTMAAARWFVADGVKSEQLS